MTALSYLARRFPGQDLEPETELSDLRNFDALDRMTLAQVIDEARPASAPLVTEAELESWVTIADVLACEAEYERKAA